ncbi:MAG TPA: porin family protein [Puia sp.]|nr:porin family protein [Puia sp.]
MKYSDDDMDDLFRRAAERYPLRTDSADWNRLSGALDGEPAPPADEGTKRRRRGVFWWFLLVPLAGIGYLTWQVQVRHSHAGDAPTATASNSQAVGANPPTATVSNPPTATAANGPGSARTADAAAVPDRSAAANGRATGRRVVAATQNNVARDGQDVVGQPKVNGTTPGTGTTPRTGTTPGTGRVRHLRTRSDRASGSGTPITALTSNAALRRDPALARDLAPDRDAAVRHDAALAALDLRLAPIGERNRLVVDVVAPEMAAAPDDHASLPKKPKRKPDGNLSNNKPHAYIGLSAAPDFSTVRFQKMTGVGTTFGLLLGYSFNARWAVESGIYVDRKRYYTSGEYFNTKNVRLPYNSTLLNVDGTCYMWEIPLNVRYNFTTSPNPKTKWFGTAGLSTYLMSREKYTYEYASTTGGWGTGDSLWDIHKPSQYWLMIVNLGVGFEQRIGRAGNLRLEPYVRIPMAGIGTGRLSILSAGVNIGFTRQLW